MAQAEAYFTVGIAGDVKSIHDTFFGTERKEEYKKEQQRFQEQFAAIRENPDAVKGFLAEHTTVLGTPLDAISYEEHLAQLYRIADPEIERIDIVGQHARISFSAEVPATHPHKQIQKDLGVARPVSSMYLVFETGRWLAESYYNADFDAADGLHLMPTREKFELEPKTVRIETIKKSTHASVGVSAYSISFGY